MTLRVLNRYLSLESFVRTRQSRRHVKQSVSPESSGSDHLRHEVVQIGGHRVSVTEDEVGVVELHED